MHVKAVDNGRYSDFTLQETLDYLREIKARDRAIDADEYREARQSGCRSKMQYRIAASLYRRNIR